MRFSNYLLQAGLLLCSTSQVLAAPWTFTDATVSVQSRGAGVGGSFKEKLSPSTPLKKVVDIGPADTLKIILTTQDGKAAARPHQAFLLLRDDTSNLDISYPFSVKDTGKGKIDLTYKDLPSQFSRSQSPLSAKIVLGSFGSSQGYKSEVFKLKVTPDPNAPTTSSEKPLRYGKLPEIHHIFRADPKSPVAIISLVFAAATLATVPLLFGAWLYLGGNVNHLQKALSDAPVAHGLFVGSIFGLEGVLILYYTIWNLFQALPALLALGVVALVSGSRALTEVQDRRLAGAR